MLSTIGGWLLLVASVSQASPYAVESAPFDHKTDAEALAGAISGKGEVVRRYVRGAGWVYVVRWGKVPEIDRARELARTVAEATGEAVTIYDVAKGPDAAGEVVSATTANRAARVSTPVATVPWEGSKHANAAAPSASVDASPRASSAHAKAERILKAAIRAHGGRSGGRAVIALSRRIRFAYEQEVYATGEDASPSNGTRSAGSSAGRPAAGDSPPTAASSPIVADDTFYRSGKALRLEVRIAQGAGVDSLTVLTPDGRAWVRVGKDGKPISRDPERTREILSRFGPQGVLALPLGFAVDALEADEWRGLVFVGTQAEDDTGELTDRLRPGRAEDRKASGGLVEAAIGAEDHLLRRVDWASDDGVVRYRYGNYFEAAKGLMIPRSVGVERDGQVVEKLTIRSLEVDPELSDSLFTAPK